MLTKVLFVLMVFGWSVSITANEVSPNAVEKFRVGMQALRGYSGFEYSPQEAFQLLQDSAKQNYAPAIYAVGWAYYSGLGTDKNLPLAIANFRQAANSGNAEGQFMMAILYGTGEGVQKDGQRSLYWLKLAAEKGHMEAQKGWRRLNGETPFSD